MENTKMFKQSNVKSLRIRFKKKKFYYKLRMENER